ncbi:hypothetical protein VNO77_20107 [Canavalia gladiata]|uniref:Uncharacterized protein n=1 Tax=Canavalia gladiata TaxID=3824 RepID=A0AAN9QL12_CANGL
MASIPSDASCSHVVLFPFMAKGHTIPLLQFAQILLCRSTAVTVITTPANHQFIAELLNCTAASIVTLPFPIAADIPAGVESTDKLPSMSLFTKFGLATSAMQPHFEQLLETLPRVSFMVTDAFLWWTLHSAKKLGIPRLVFYGMSCYSYCLSMVAKSSGIFSGSQRDDELVALSRFPWIKLSKEYFTLNYRDPKPKSLEYIFSMEVSSSTYNSYGMLVNSFYELEPLFAANCNTQCDGSFRNWCVGPLCLAEQTPKKVHSEPGVKPRWVQWLDKKLEKKCWNNI